MGATFDSDFLNIFTSFHIFTRGKRKMVPQGSILGPLLFVIYINDLRSILECCCASLYADDTVIYCYGSSSQELSDKLNRDLLAVAKWLNDHKLTLNLYAYGY